MAQENFEEEIGHLKPVQLGALPAKPLISILTPNYNYAKFVAEAIESVLAQTYGHFEMIVCDDGSTDNSCEIVKSYAHRDPRIKFISKENGGVATALNTAYRESKGEIVCLLDADDRYLPDKLAMVVQAFQSHPDSGFLAHRVFHIDATGRQCGVTPFLVNHESGWYGPFVIRHGDVPPALLTGAALCLRREVSDLIFPLSERFRSLLDAVIMTQATLMTPVIWLSASLGEYRNHGNNLTNTTHINSESWNHALQNGRMLWEVRREYLRSVHPRLTEIFPEFDRRLGAPIGTYIQTKLQTSGRIWRPYRCFLRSESFSSLPWLARWFWRCSVFLPRPLFRRAMNIVLRPNRIKQLLWKAGNAMRVRNATVTDESARSLTL